MRLITEVLTAEHGVKHFTSGEPALDHFLKRFALRNQDAGLGVTYVLARPASAEGRSEVYGYYTLAPSKVRFDLLPDSEKSPQGPRYDRPTILLARLAVDEGEQGKRIGERLLLDACHRACELARMGGGTALEVDAMSEKAKGFYLRYQFIAYVDDPRHLFLPVRSIRAQLEPPEG